MSETEIVIEEQSKTIPPVEEKPKAEKTTALPIAVDKQGMMVARDNSELMRMIRTMMAGNAFPKTLDTPEKAIAAWQVAASLRLPPAVAIQNMAVIHGSVCIWGQLPKALAEATGELEDFQMFFINKEQKPINMESGNLADEVWGAVCRIKRKGRSINEYAFTENDAAKANLLTKAGPWKEHRKIMYGRRAMTTAIRFEFPDALMGIGVAEYDHGVAPDITDVTPEQDFKDSAMSKINNILQQ